MVFEVLTLVFDQLNRALDAEKEELRREEIAITLVKEAVFGFYSYWKLYSSHSPYNITDGILRDYARVFTDVSVKIRFCGVFPNDVIDDLDLFGFALRMQSIADEPKGQDAQYFYVEATNKLLNDIYCKFEKFDKKY